jgi:membrane protease YdiL (CAAX protease family)
MQAVRDLLTPELLPETVESVSASRRRRLVVAGTLAAGAVVLGATLAAPRGSLAFTLLGVLLAAIWVTGSAAAGPLDVGPSTDRAESARSLLAAIVVGGLAFVAFLGASLVAHRVPGLDGAVDSVLATADAGSPAVVLAIAVVNAVAEERFFRGALPVAVVGNHRAAIATALYVLVTAATLNIALVVAAAAMGTVFMLERLATGGILAPTFTHVTWSTLMLLALPG